MAGFTRGSDPGARAGHRPLAIVGAASSIGIRPYDHGGEARHLDRAPGVLRELGIVSRLGAGDLVAPLAGHPAALGMQVTIYDPALDADRACAMRLVALLEKVLANGSAEARS